MGALIDGYGSGDGSGYGDGDGDGYGYGDGSGYGSGYGDGSGSGSGYWKDCAVALMPTEKVKRSEELSAGGAVVAFWRSTRNGTPANGGSGTRAAPGLVEEIAGPLEICTKNALHGTKDPKKWKGERLWLAAYFPPIAEEDDKIGSLKREFLGEVDPVLAKMILE